MDLEAVNHCNQRTVLLLYPPSGWIVSLGRHREHSRLLPRRYHFFLGLAIHALLQTLVEVNQAIDAWSFRVKYSVDLFLKRILSDILHYHKQTLFVLGKSRRYYQQRERG